MSTITFEKAICRSNVTQHLSGSRASRDLLEPPQDDVPGGRQLLDVVGPELQHLRRCGAYSARL